MSGCLSQELRDSVVSFAGWVHWPIRTTSWDGFWSYSWCFRDQTADPSGTQGQVFDEGGPKLCAWGWSISQIAQNPPHLTHPPHPHHKAPATRGLITKEEIEEKRFCYSSFVQGKNSFWDKNTFFFLLLLLSIPSFCYSAIVCYLSQKTLGRVLWVLLYHATIFHLNSVK